MPSMTAKSLRNAIERMIKNRGLNMEIIHSKVEKRIPADSAVPDKHVYFNVGPDPTSKDAGMKKSLDYAPYFYNNHLDKQGNYVTDKKHLIKKG